MSLSILNMATKGFWFCEACERVCDLRDDARGGNCCGRCGSAQVRFNEPVLAPDPEETTNQKDHHG